MLRWSGWLAAAVVAIALGPAVAQTGGVEGTWLSQSGTEITIEACDEGYCGRISKIVVPEEYKRRYGKALEALTPEQYFDFNNKDPALRQRPILGLRIITMRATEAPIHFVGELYNPEDGNTYAGRLELTGPDRLVLTGCVLLVLCKGEEWSRVPAPRG